METGIRFIYRSNYLMFKYKIKISTYLLTF